MIPLATPLNPATLPARFFAGDVPAHTIKVLDQFGAAFAPMSVNVDGRCVVGPNDARWNASRVRRLG